MSLRPRPRLTPAEQVQSWNTYVDVGAEIEFRETPIAPARRFKTTTVAMLLGGHTAVVWVEGKRGCVNIEHCRAVGMISRPWTDVQW